VKVDLELELVFAGIFPVGRALEKAHNCAEKISENFFPSDLGAFAFGFDLALLFALCFLLSSLACLCLWLSRP